MALDVIEKLKNDIAEYKAALDEAKGVAQEAKDTAEALQVDIDRKGIFSGNSDMDLTEAKALASAIKIKSAVLGVSASDTKEYSQLKDMLTKAIKPADIDSWIDEKFSKELEDLMALEMNVEKLFKTIKVPNGYGRLALPRKTENTRAYLIQPADSAIESALTGDKVVFSPVKLKVMVQLADEAENEDVLESLYSVIKEDIAYALAKGIEEAIISGDKSGALNGNPAATDPTKAFDGLRKYADAVKVDGGGATLTLDKFREARKAMGKFGVNPSELVFLVNPSVYFQLISLTDKNIVTTATEQSQLGNMNGVITYIDGVRVVISEYVPEDLDANGIKGGDLTEALLVNVRGFKVGKRDGIDTEKDRDIVRDVDVIVGRAYRDFQKVTIGTTAAVIVNVAK